MTQYNIVSQCLVRSIDGEYYMRAFGNFQVIGYVCVCVNHRLMDSVLCKGKTKTTIIRLEIYSLAPKDISNLLDILSYIPYT